MVDELGESAVAYSPIIIEKLKGQEPFIPTFYEWLFARGEQVLVSNEDTGGTGGIILYQVPTGYTLFVMSAWLEGRNLGAIVGNICITPGTTSGNNSLLMLRLVASVNTPFANSINYPIPLRFDSGTPIYLVATGNGKGWGGLAGYLIRKDIIPQI